MKNSRKAFSLIELLIVITIIGILAVAFLPSITTGPSRARDTQRVSDISDIALALELYFQDTGGYPAAGPIGLINTSGNPGENIVAYFDNNAIPSDPQASTTLFSVGANYYYNGTANSYTLAAAVENGKVAEGYCVMPGSAPAAGFDCTELTNLDFQTATPVYILSKG